MVPSAANLAQTTWKRMYAIADRVLDGVTAEEQRRIAEVECAGDSKLLEHVLDLVRQAEAPPSLFDQPAVPGDGVAGLFAEPKVEGTRLGSYRVVSELGRGGMGRVYLADRDDGQFEKRVALKVTGAWWGLDAGLREQFLRERQILAGLEHPGIARLLDGGETQEGQPFLAMEYVDGSTLTSYCRERKLGVRQTIELFLPICDAVEYAHHRLVVHRDIKPSNILVETATGQPKLLDFGVARLTDAAGAVTHTAAMQMTPSYASPEQAAGAPVTTVTDIYSLGVVLYELLTGQLPYKLAGRPVAEALRVVAEGKVIRPRQVRPELSPDLEAILLKALAQDPEARYESAGRLREDLERYLEHRPVQARKGAWSYRAHRFLWRYRWSLAAGVALVAVLSGWLVESTFRRQEARVRTEQVRQIANLILTEYMDRLADLPNSMELRSKMAREAAASLDKIVDSSRFSRSAAQDLEVALAYRKLGDIQGAGWQALGDFEGAARALDRAIKIREELLQQAPGNPDALFELSQDQVKLAVVLGRAQSPRVPQAVAIAVASVARVPAARMQQRDAQLNLVQARTLQAQLYSRSGKIQEMIRENYAVVEIVDRLRAQMPDDLEVRLRASNSHSWMSSNQALQMPDDLALLLDAERHAVISEQLADIPHAAGMAPNLWRRIRYLRACGLIALGKVQLALTRLHHSPAMKAESSFRHAAELLRELSVEDRGERRTFTELIDASLFQADALRAAGQIPAAKEVAARLVREAGESLQTMPTGQQPDHVLIEYWEEALRDFVSPADRATVERVRQVLQSTASQTGPGWEKWRAATMRGLKRD